MDDFVVFMVSTFLRPSEWEGIRYRDVTVVGGATPHVKITGVDGKTGVRDVHSMPDAIRAFRRLQSRSGGDPDAYLFKPDSHNRLTAGERMRDSFELLLQEMNLKLGNGGKLRSSCSLRHSAIMFRLQSGNVPLLLLAKAAGTGVEQIERFYGSHLEVSMRLANCMASS